MLHRTWVSIIPCVKVFVAGFLRAAWEVWIITDTS